MRLKVEGLVFVGLENSKFRRNNSDKIKQYRIYRSLYKSRDSLTHRTTRPTKKILDICAPCFKRQTMNLIFPVLGEVLGFQLLINNICHRLHAVQIRMEAKYPLIPTDPGLLRTHPMLTTELPHGNELHSWTSLGR